MLISTSVLIGAATFATYFGVTMLAVDKKLKYYNIVIDPAAKELQIKCNSNKISIENFKVYTRLEHNEVYLYTKGSEVLDTSKDIVSVDHRYCLKNINPDDVCKMTWRIDCDQLVVTIPLSDLHKKLRVKKLK